MKQGDRENYLEFCKQIKGDPQELLHKFKIQNKADSQMSSQHSGEAKRVS